MVLLEGTNLSEGRGTTRPFEFFGAPFLNPYELTMRLDRMLLPGVRFRPCHFEPTFQKYAGEFCGGAQLHVLDRQAFRPVETAVSILHAVRQLAPTEFAWRPPPYEYEEEKMPIDILWGSEALRVAIDAGVSAGEILEETRTDVRDFEQLVDSFLLYE
jgi:uncharacterized protein YbbC (DUF1343 family)